MMAAQLRALMELGELDCSGSETTSSATSKPGASAKAAASGGVWDPDSAA